MLLTLLVSHFEMSSLKFFCRRKRARKLVTAEVFHCEMGPKNLVASVGLSHQIPTASARFSSVMTLLGAEGGTEVSKRLGPSFSVVVLLLDCFLAVPNSLGARMSVDSTEMIIRREIRNTTSQRGVDSCRCRRCILASVCVGCYGF